VDEFFERAELVSLDLVEGEEALSAPPGQLDGLHIVLAEPVLEPVLLDLPLALLLGRVVAGVDDEVVLAGDSRLLHVVLEHLLEVEVEAHEVAEGLLAEQPLRLHVDLPDGLAGQALGLHYLLPLAHSELHQRQLQDMHFFRLPPRR
jgi:hypothetical protein